MIKVLFCALNEEKSLKKFLVDLTHEMQVIKNKNNNDFEIIACLDGTIDNSRELIEANAKFCNIKILPLTNQKGLGRAYKRLFENAIANSSEEDTIVTLDADNTHNPNQIQEMIAHLKEHDLDILIASRFCNTSAMNDFPLYRKFISKTTAFLLKKLFRTKKINADYLRDFTSGYRAYKAGKIIELKNKIGNDFISEPEFTYTCEFLIKLARINAKIDEIPISYDYGKKVGKSKLSIIRNFWRLIILLFKLSK
ncbi:MAG: glycosyltransferase [Rickettsiales bacterium]|nr:glycosyltransferase [Rickettsiales bacterium]